MLRKVVDYEFRVWDEIAEQMVYFTFGKVYNEFLHGYYYGNYVENNGRKRYLTAEGGQDNPELEVMQYTGLIDKNGAKIFEGDILGGSTTHPLLVSIKEGHTQVTFKVRDRIYTQPIFQGEIVDDEHLVVIGNKWDNPELLEVR